MKPAHQASSPEKRYLHFGVREHAMAAILNGIAYHNSGLIPYGGTFLVFADYMRGSMRLSALSELGVIYVLTHDSIGVGEDAPRTSPSKPSPCGRCRTCWCSVLATAMRPAVPTRWPSRTASAPAPCLSRQGMANQANSSIDKVAWVVMCSKTAQELPT